MLPQTNDSYLTLGCILPDLARESKIDWKADFYFPPVLDNFNSSQLLTGAKHHVEIDAKFHNSDFFKKHTSAFAKVFRENPNISLTKYSNFFSHILLEVLLDYLWIKKHPDLLVQFYTLLHQVDVQFIKEILYHLAPEQDLEIFEDRFKNFMERQFLHKYKDLEDVIKFVIYVYEKTCKLDIDNNRTEQYLLITKNQLLPEIRNSVPQLWEQLKTNI